MKKMRDFAICTVGWSIFFLILSPQWLRLNFIRAHIIAIFPLNSFFIFLIHFPMESLVLFVLIYQSSVNEKKDDFLFRSERDGFLFILWIFCEGFFFFFLFCSQKKKTCKDSFHSSRCWGTEHSVLTSTRWSCVCALGTVSNCPPLKTHISKDWGVKAWLPLDRVGDPKHRGTSRPGGRDWGLFSECVFVVEKKQNKAAT